MVVIVSIKNVATLNSGGGRRYDPVNAFQQLSGSPPKWSSRLRGNTCEQREFEAFDSQGESNFMSFVCRYYLTVK